MNVNKSDLEWAASRGLISSEQGESLWKALASRVETQPRLNFVNFL